MLTLMNTNSCSAHVTEPADLAELHELVGAIGPHRLSGPARAPGAAARRITAVIDDSRHAAAGCLFVASQGAKVDGHEFIPAVIAAGAAVIVVRDDYTPPPAVSALAEHVTFVHVPDTRLALARIAARFHGVDALLHRQALKLFAVTGTNGKTTTTYIIQSLFNSAGIRCGRIGTTNYDTTRRIVPADNTTPGAVLLTNLLREMADHGASACAIEASSHALDQRRLEALPPAVGVFTNLTGDHLDYHGSMENYRDAKARLFSLLLPGGTAAVNLDAPYGDHMVNVARTRADLNVLTFGFSPASDVWARIHDITASGSTFTLTTPGGSAAVHSPLVGRHNVSNLLAAACCGMAAGLTIEQIAAAMSQVAFVPGRLQRVPGGPDDLAVLVDYAHTDDALANVLSALRPIVAGRLICVFGCGGDRDRTKRPRMANVAEQWADAILITSDNPRTEDPQRILDDITAGLSPAGRAKATVQMDRRLAIQSAIALAAPGDCVLIAGKGHEDYQIIGTTKHHFDDVEEAAAALATK